MTSPVEYIAFCERLKLCKKILKLVSITSEWQTIAEISFATPASVYSPFLPKLLPPANKVCEGYVFTRVLSFCPQGGVYLAGTPRTRYTPPGPGTPPRPGSPPGTGTPPGSWEIRATSGRYASYWNAFLLDLISDSIKVVHFSFSQNYNSVLNPSKNYLRLSVRSPFSSHSSAGLGNGRGRSRTRA